jgi:hypothetical protein
MELSANMSKILFQTQSGKERATLMIGKNVLSMILELNTKQDYKMI